VPRYTAKPRHAFLEILELNERFGMNKSANSDNMFTVIRTLVYAVLLSAAIWGVSPIINKSEGVIPDGERRLDKTESYANEPLRIINVKAANKSIALGEKFDGGDDWLKDASVRVKNISDKDIIYIEIDFNFPETRTSGNEMSYRLKMGHRPEAHDTNPPLMLKRNDEALLTLDQEKYDQLLRFVGERHPISAIRRAVIRIGFVIFADGTAWSGGLFHRRDPNNPNRYVPVND
jgi:hypothetical protein